MIVFNGHGAIVWVVALAELQQNPILVMTLERLTLPDD